MPRRPSAGKVRRDRWRRRVVDGMTPELRAALTPAEVMYLWAAATNGDRYYFAHATVASLREKGLLVQYAATDSGHRLTQKGARWALRILDIYDAVPVEGDLVPSGERRHGWMRVAGYRRTTRLANGEPPAALRDAG